MSTPDDEIPDEEDEELEPDDWSEDSSLWGDEPIERPRAFADPNDAVAELRPPPAPSRARASTTSPSWRP